MRAHGTVEADGNRFMVRPFRITTGSVAVQGELCGASEVSRFGAILVWAGPLAVAASLDGIQSSLVLHQAPAWYRHYDSRNVPCFNTSFAPTLVAE
jgi:hypothetical protein